MQYIEQGTSRCVEEHEADTAGTEAVTGQVTGFGRDKGRRRLGQALEQVIDAAVEGKGIVIGREAPGRIAQYIAPVTAGRSDFDLRDLRGRYWAQKAQSASGFACLSLALAQCAFA